MQRPATPNYPNWHTRNWSPTNFARQCGDDRPRSTARSLHRPLTAPSIAARGASHVHAVLHAANIVQRIESRWQLLSLAGSWSRTTFGGCPLQSRTREPAEPYVFLVRKASPIAPHLLRYLHACSEAQDQSPWPGGGDHTFKRHVIPVHELLAGDSYGMYGHRACIV